MSLEQIVRWVGSRGGSLSDSSGLIPLSDLDRCQNATVLDMCDRDAFEISADVVSLGNLETLTLTRTGVEKLPDELQGLEGLTELNLGGNSFRGIPDVVFDLPSLLRLTVSRNRLSCISPAISKLERLELLNARRNALTQLPAGLFDLANLRELDLSENELTAVPPSVGLMRSLRKLYLSGNAISELPPEIGDLAQLESLAVSGNRLSRLPTETRKLRNLQSVWTYDNPLRVPPSGIAAQGPAAIRAYFTDTDNGGESPLRTAARVMIVGPPGVGKTALAARLRTGEFSGPEREETRGVERHCISIGVGLDADIWDFGGQRFMHSGHRLFLDGGTNFVLVLDADSIDDAEYWMHLLTSLSSNARVLIVINKRDTSRADVDRRSLSERFPSIEEFHQVSCLEGSGLLDLEQSLTRLASDEVNARILPTTWVAVYHSLKEDAVRWVTHDEFLRRCSEQGLTDKSVVSTFRKFLSDAGLVVSLPRMNGHPVVVDIDWFADCLYSFLASRAVEDSLGFLPERVVNDTAREHADDADGELVIATLHEFEFCVPVGHGILLFPDFLPDTSDSYGTDLKGAEVRHLIQLLSDPTFVLARLLVRLAEDVQVQHAWRFGMDLISQHLDAEATVMADRESKLLRLIVSGRDRNAYLSILRVQVRGICRDYGLEAPADLIPHPTGHIDYDHALGLYLMGEKDLVLGKTQTKLDLSEILFGRDGKDGSILMNGPIFNFDRSAVNFGSGGAMNVNSGELTSIAAQLVQALRESNLDGTDALADDLAQASLDEESPRIKTLAQRAYVIAAGVAPIAGLASAVVNLTS